MKKAILDRLTVLAMSVLYFFSFWLSMQIVIKWYTFVPPLHTSVVTVSTYLLVALAGAASIIGFFDPRITPASCESLGDRLRMLIVATLVGSLCAFAVSIVLPLLIIVVLIIGIVATLFLHLK